MWPYERYLPDYDPTQYADLQRGIRSQPIVRRHKHTAVASSKSEDDSKPSPWEKVDRNHRRVDNHHAHVLKNNGLALNARYDLYPDAHPEAARPEHSREERLALEERNEDRHILRSMNRKWAAFRQKQVELRELQRELDTVQGEISLWELRRRGRWSPYLPPEIERELHRRQAQKTRLELQMKRLVCGTETPRRTSVHALTPVAEKGTNATNRTVLTPHFQEQLESEYSAYQAYAGHHDYSEEARPLFQLEWQFHNNESILPTLQRELADKRREIRQLATEEHVLVRRRHVYGPHPKQDVDLDKLKSELHEVRKKLGALQEEEAELADQVGHLENFRKALDRHRIETAPSDWSKDAAGSLTQIGSSSSSPPPGSPQSSDRTDSAQSSDEQPLIPTRA